MRSVTERTLAAMAIAAAFAVVPGAQAQEAPGRQDTMAMLVVSPAALRAEAAASAERYAEGQRLRAAGDGYAAFLAFHEAALLGHPKAQRRLGEIYDAGDADVRRDYLKSIRWYQAARMQGEDIPAPARRSYGPSSSLR